MMTCVNLGANAESARSATQRQRGDEVPQKKITVHVPLIGGGFGRRLQSDYAVEAAQVSRAINVPVQVFWTRDDDLQHDYYHEMSIQYPSASCLLQRCRVSGQGRLSVPTGAWRSVGNFNEAYATRVSSMKWPRLYNVTRLIAPGVVRRRALEVIKLAAEKAGWGNPLPAGWGRGLGYHATFGVTHVAHVRRSLLMINEDIRVQRVVCAVDCGKVVNPDNVAAQMEGGMVFGLTAALKAEATLVNGRVQQSNSMITRCCK